MLETQRTISDWAEKTFGPANSNFRVAVRANEEMAELLRALAVDDDSPYAPLEIADVAIVLFRLADKMNRDLLAEVDMKMSINRARQWAPDGTGHGYHIEEGAVSAQNQSSR